MSEDVLTVLKNVKVPRPGVIKGLVSFRTMDLVVTSSRIFASLDDESTEDNSRIIELSIPFDDVRRIYLNDFSTLPGFMSLGRTSDERRLTINYYSGDHRFWNIVEDWFQIDRTQFDELRTLLPALPALRDKVTLKA